MTGTRGRDPGGIAEFTFPNRVLFGAGASARLAAEAVALGIRRPLLVTDPGLVADGLAAAVASALPGVIVFSEVQANPAESDVEAGLEIYQQQACDGLIALGGGSPIDAAKAIRLRATHPAPLALYDFNAGGEARIQAGLPPMIAVPTTAGTGSEVARGTLIQIPSVGRKVFIRSPFLLPSLAVCDPDLTRSMPPTLTAATGMDAFTHCVESFLSTTYHPVCDGIAREGLRHLARGLESAVRDGHAPRPRRDVMMGALLGGISFHKGLGVVHSLSHALGGEGRAHHGTLNAVLLPHALRYNREAAEPALVALATELGVGRGAGAVEHLITLVELVIAGLPLPRRLGALPGLDRARIPDYARLALADHCHRTNPRPCTPADLEALLDRAW